jgi:hypothetical protein
MEVSTVPAESRKKRKEPPSNTDTPLESKEKRAKKANGTANPEK